MSYGENNAASGGALAATANELSASALYCFYSTETWHFCQEDICVYRPGKLCLVEDREPGSPC